ncbi:hypothetical protein APR50_32695 [Variovorax paradoxus]|uniref:hypothetical protein n=1 Tax=Variovorax paradoxus TaxID=34073 RepID=UPI0006E4AF5A|nr:hypothetical protein APR52_13900 [Variovorax paradoxus]KPV00479.1 hypothetical protein APR50_32695 [Variovorax paradoxus]KPV08064.1 hypothetical protein APR49_15970 [Variovorax paradoxus]KPV22527.1 hypothetical protein APR51_09965 [Variovorax paradoxus]KPV35402.1 hypothetical protein APR48_04485 [Variovorax paradoxus]
MKAIPILFSAPMVRAVLRDEDPKLQTRRLLKMPHGLWETSATGELVPIPANCPYGKPGGRLWGRETFFAWGRWEKRHSEKKGRLEWHFIDMTLKSGNSYLYAADGVSNTQAFAKRRGDPAPMYWKRPAIFMPRAASRIQLEVTDVRIERLLSISESDAIAEGIVRYRGPLRWLRYLDAVTGEPEHNTARDAFLALWDDINGPECRAANPWVWAVSFRRIAS